MTYGEALARWASERGDHVAIRADGREVTYRELYGRANSVANLVTTQPAAGPRHVAILLEQGIDAMAAIFGVVTAGRAYICLDPHEPIERLRLVAADCEAPLLITDEAHAALARDIAPAGVQVLDIATAANFPASLAVPIAVAEGDPAVIVYTSGSTGQPKGVVRSHRSELWFGRAFGERLGLTADDRLTLLSSLSFGAANTDIGAAMAYGLTLCMFDTRRHGLEPLPRWFAGEDVTIFHTVPTIFRYIAANPPADGYSTVRAIDVAGEPVYGHDVRLARSAFGTGTVFVNRYSATEIVAIAQYVARPGDEDRETPLPAGVPPTGAEVVLLDTNGREVAPGEAGEVVVRSRYLADGYWRRPDLTMRAFSDDPGEPGDRLYRTGDGASRDPEGVLTVLGRLDKRVKIHGMSVEPAEVEAALRSVPGVRDALIDVERAGAGPDAEIRLVGYVTTSAAVDGRTIRQEVAARVPIYMVPASVRVLGEFPVTRTGKVDRLALLALPPEAPTDDAALGTTVAGDPPRGGREERVAQLFAQILGVPVNSRDDDFFALGGTSMTLAQLQTELRRQMGGSIDLADVIRSATVAGVAAAVGSSAGRSENASSLLAVPLRPVGSSAPLFLIHGWHGQAYVTPGFLDAVPDEHPVWSIQARGLADGLPPLRTVPDMAEAYLDAIAAIGHERPPILVGICAGGVIAIEMAHQAYAGGRGHLPVIMLDPPFPPYARPLHLRARDLAAFYVGLYTPSSGPARAVSNRIVRRLRTRAERIGTPDLDHATLQNDEAVRVALSVGIALRRHRPQTYDGPIRVIASERRLTNATWRSDIWRRVLTGPIELIGAGTGHLDTLNPANLDFRAALRRAIGAIDANEIPVDRDHLVVLSQADTSSSGRIAAADDRSIG